MNILRAPEAAKKAGFSVPTLWRKSKEPGFPRPVKVTENVTGWVAEELDDWLAKRVAESRKVAA